MIFEKTMDFLSHWNICQPCIFVKWPYTWALFLESQFGPLFLSVCQYNMINISVSLWYIMIQPFKRCSPVLILLNFLSFSNQPIHLYSFNVLSILLVYCYLLFLPSIFIDFCIPMSVAYIILSPWGHVCLPMWIHLYRCTLQLWSVGNLAHSSTTSFLICLCLGFHDSTLWSASFHTVPTFSLRWGFTLFGPIH